MLYLMTFAEMEFSLQTLPYLTRVITIPTNGVATYMKAVMQLLLEVALSATKEIVDANVEKMRLILALFSL